MWAGEAAFFAAQLDQLMTRVTRRWSLDVNTLLNKLSTVRDF